MSADRSQWGGNQNEAEFFRYAIGIWRIHTDIRTNAKVKVFIV